MKVAFVVMPWHSLHYPCLAAGLLHAVTKDRRPSWEFVQIYANVMWAEHLLTSSRGALSPVEYAMVGEDLFFISAGEWVFSSALHGEDEWRVEEYKTIFLGDEKQFATALAAHRLAPSFVSDLASDIVASGATVLALTSTFMQNVPCLALAKAVKSLNPAIVTVMGGGNCDGIQGQTLHANFPFIDYVVCGEGEIAFDLLLEAIEQGRSDLSHVPNLCWRDVKGQHRNPSASEITLDKQPVPFFDDYFEQLKASGVRAFVEPQLVIETARGCWWGEKHHCTFCGLNGTAMHFRSKSPGRALEEIEHLVSRHQLLDVIVADNIMDMSYFHTLLPMLRECGWDMRLHYEVKANLKREHIHLLQDCGVRHIQPGIESLSSSVLKIMEKGITGARNVQTLRDCEEANLTCSWNYLLGFPGEEQQHYEPILRQLPALVHLQPPSGVSRIVLERFSPYFNKPWLGFADKTPHCAYAVIYGMTDTQLGEMVYLYEAPQRGVSEETRERFAEGIDQWREAYDGGSQLVHRDVADEIEIEDRRIGWPKRTTRVADSIPVSILRALRGPLKLPALERRLNEQGLRPSNVRPYVDELVERGWVFEEEGNFISVSTRPIPFRVRYAYA